MESVHERKRPFSCTLCPSTFFSRASLKLHMETVHEEKKLWFESKCPTSILSDVMWSVDAFIEWCTSSWKIRPENRRISKNPTFFSPKCCSCIYFDVSIIHLFKYDSNFSICNLKVFKIWIFWKLNGQKLMHWFASHRELCLKLCVMVNPPLSFYCQSY